MTVLELAYHQMFPEDGDPGWHAGQLPDGRRVHAASMPCKPGELHRAGSVEDPNACECDGNGACNLCLIRDDGGLVFTRVTGCYRYANSTVRALQHWAANPDAPPPPAPFDCRWTTMQAILCQNAPGAPPMSLGTTRVSRDPATYHGDGAKVRTLAELTSPHALWGLNTPMVGATISLHQSFRPLEG